MKFKNILIPVLFSAVIFNSCKKDTVNHPPVVIAGNLTLQPNNNPTEIHLLGNSTSNESDPTSPEIGGAAWTIGGNPVGMRAALQFDLSSIPSNAIITSAKLTLYSDHTPINGNQVDANYGTDNSLLIQQIASPWLVSNVSWQNQPVATTTNQITVPTTTQSFLDLDSLDVTVLVSSMVSNNSNYGFFIRLQNEVIYTSRIFCSSKYADSTRHPKLVVQYGKTN